MSYSIKMQNLNTDDETRIEVLSEIEIKLESRVVLFNDEWHLYEEVVLQIQKALHCNIEKAESLTLEAHSKGSAIVFTGELHRCLKVSSVLEEISLRTTIIF